MLDGGRIGRCFSGREGGNVDGRFWLFRAVAQSAGCALVEMKL